MQYSTVLMFAIFTAGAVGGTASFVGSGGDTSSVGAAIGEARSAVRDKMREIDGGYYRRGEAYETCASAYGGRVAGQKANGDITLSCECFDKSIRLLGGHDRETALAALGPQPGTATASRIRATAAAKRTLRHCDIEPWAGGPAMPSLRQGGEVVAKSVPADETLPDYSMSGKLRGTF